MYDFIGDIHGYSDKLEELLIKLGYKKENGIYKHKTRVAFFLGDYIDRGPSIIKTLKIVKDMVEAKSAKALMGNHEYNAVCFYMQDESGGHLREHSIKNIIMHYEMLKQFDHKEDEYKEYITWMKTLPLFYEDEFCRAVHACFDEDIIEYLKKELNGNTLSDEAFKKASKIGSKLNFAVEDITKGKEVRLPKDILHYDQNGNARTHMRIKWWENPQNITYKDISVEKIEGLPKERVDVSLLRNTNYYKSGEKPVFFGHYWFRGEPRYIKENVCCLDFSVAKGGKLTCYRFDNEQKLDNSKFIYV
ncbi:MAG: metallophosphoesterase [Campylobacteraceae bacterium]